MAQHKLGRRAVVERTTTLMDGETMTVWRVGVQGHDRYAWQVLGLSEQSFEHALAKAVRHQGVRG